MRRTSRASRPSWPGILTVALMGLQTAHAVELNVESDGEKVLCGNHTNNDLQGHRINQASRKGSRNEHDDILYRYEPG